MTMSVQDLIEALEQMDPTAMVILSRDPEGNSYAPVEDTGEGFFDTKFSEYYDDPDTIDLEVNMDEPAIDEEYKKPKNAVPAVVLWPAY